ncbi:MAG: bifunctional 2-C-methyl-D-erythritol 4-phosphate cytidylyltransferase/2-C-methyl-D-erythritol 2,4-cyclodiphosphate synthase, partial [Pseudomonadota bacterium]
PRVAALIVAAGRGARAGVQGGPKQNRPHARETVLARTHQAFLAHPAVGAVRVVIHRDDHDLYADAVRTVRDADGKLLAPTEGGAERQDSVRLGLESLSEARPEIVLIHDAARPFVDAGVIARVIDAVGPGAGAVAALPVFDTLKKASHADGAMIDETVPRAGLWRAQTPQGFAFADILAAHRAAQGRVLTDDAAVAEADGLPVALVAGSPDNMKITQAEDFGMAEVLLNRSAAMHEFRTGHGYDVHAFEDGDHVVLCGVDIPHDAQLKGHSDADVGMHALTDALFGALCEGDIGDHFPPSDPQWKGAPSHVFLARARERVEERGGAITHCDVTLACEAPRIGPHRAAMRAALSDILHVPAERISVKATTTERLGFTGRKEGIAAIATATVRLPAGD